MKRKKKQPKKEVESDLTTQLYNFRNPYPLPMKASNRFVIRSTYRLKAFAAMHKFNNIIAK